MDPPLGVPPATTGPPPAFEGSPNSFFLVSTEITGSVSGVLCAFTCLDSDAAVRYWR